MNRCCQSHQHRKVTLCQMQVRETTSGRWFSSQPVTFRKHHYAPESQMKPYSLHFPLPQIRASTKSFHEPSLTGTGCHGTSASNTKLIWKDMAKHSKSQFSKIDSKIKDMWAAVRKLTGRHQIPADIEGVPAQSINDHYAAISTDPCYTSAHRKDPANLTESEYISEWQVFQCLITYARQPQVLMAFQPGSSVWAPQSFFNPLLTFSISRLPHQPFHSSGSKLTL